MINRLFRKLSPNKQQLNREELEEGRRRREQIVKDAEAMKRLSENADFKRFCEMLEEDKRGLVENLLDENTNNIKSAEAKTRLIARVNQIDKVLNKPKSLIWRMENLTEVRDAIKEQTLVRQAHGNKTGG